MWLIVHVAKDPVQKDSQLSPKREIALSSVPLYWELELMLSPSIKFDFDITTSNYDIDTIENNTYFTS